MVGHHGGWIGVDLDGTIAEYHGWVGGVGAPIPLMVERVKRWIANGVEVRIFTARVSGPNAEEQRILIENWCAEHIGQIVPVTHCKDYNMIQLWDDRAIQVEPNTGKGYDQYPQG